MEGFPLFTNSNGPILLPPSSTFQCNVCNFTAFDGQSVARHQLTEHVVPAQIHQCDCCDFSTPSKEDWISHREVHRDFRCHFCSVISGSMESAMRHQRLRHPDHKECNLCGTFLANRMELHYHRAAQHGEEWRCFFCSFKIRNISSNYKCKFLLIDHLKVCKFAAGKEGRKLPSRIGKMLPVPFDVFHCGLCDFQCKNARSLFKHKEELHNFCGNGLNVTVVSRTAHCGNTDELETFQNSEDPGSANFGINLSYDLEYQPLVHLERDVRVEKALQKNCSGQPKLDATERLEVIPDIDLTDFEGPPPSPGNRSPIRSQRNESNVLCSCGENVFDVDLVSHFKLKHGINIAKGADENHFPCKKCSRYFPSKEEYRKHIKNVHQTLLECDECNFQTKDKNIFCDHVLMFHKETKSTDKSKETEVTEVSRISHIPSIGTTVPISVVVHKCYECDFVALNKESMDTHNKSFHKKKKKSNLHKCPLCSFVTLSRPDLDHHHQSRHIRKRRPKPGPKSRQGHDSVIDVKHDPIQLLEPAAAENEAEQDPLSTNEFVDFSSLEEEKEGENGSVKPKEPEVIARPKILKKRRKKMGRPLVRSDLNRTLHIGERTQRYREKYKNLHAECIICEQIRTGAPDELRKHMDTCNRRSFNQTGKGIRPDHLVKLSLLVRRRAQTFRIEELKNGRIINRPGRLTREEKEEMRSNFFS